jgi:hypothetical protein
MNIYELIDFVTGEILEEGARIQHLEDMAIMNGSAGMQQAVAALNSMTQGGHKDVTVKWDGSPAVIFGRNENGELVFTDKSGFVAKKYDGKATSPEHLYQTLVGRRGGKAGQDPKYRAFAKTMAAAFPAFEQAVPKDYRGYFKGDMMYFDTPPIQDGDYVFKPNVVEYRVPVDSDLGKQIGRSKMGVVIHSQVDDVGDEYPLKDANIFQNSPVLAIPPVVAQQAPRMDNTQVNKLAAFAEKHGAAVDALLDPDTLRSQKMADFNNMLYAYLNSKVDSGLQNLGADFPAWLENSRASGVKKQRMLAHIQENQTGFAALWKFVTATMRIKDSIIQSLDQSSTIKQNIGGQAGGEGYVMAHPDGDMKLVPREFFSRANRAVER